MLELRDASVEFDGSGKDRIVAINRISLTVRRSEFLVVVGASGCGKSTLLRVMAGLLRCSTGEVSRDSAIDRKGGVGMVFQDPCLLEWRRVVDNVTFSGQILKIDKKTRDASARRLLDLVGLTRFARAHPRQLSGGMRQRVAICRALLPDPPLLLMDEPFAALDAITRERMNLLVQQVWSETHKTVVFVTHNIEEAVFLSDRVVIMTPSGGIARVLSNTLPRPRNTATYGLSDFARQALEIREVIENESARDLT